MTAYAKIWEGATGDYSAASNWAVINVRSSAFNWTLSGSGTTEYYLRTSASANPGFNATPGSVQINGVDATAGTIGALTAGTWAYGDNDTLGYSTIYVRLSGGTDPDASASGYVTFRQIPKATDNVTIPPASGAISSGLDQSAVAIGSFRREAGHANAIGTVSAYLQIAPTSFDHAGTGTAYIDIGSANISPTIRGTGSPSTGLHGLYLLGSNIATLNVLSGNVGVATRGGETATIATVRCVGSGAQVKLGSVVTWTTFQSLNGTHEIWATGTTLTIYGGHVTTQLAAAVTTITIYGGSLIDNSSGTKTTVTQHGGTVDVSQGGAALTWTTHKHNAGNFIDFPDRLTITTESRPDYPNRGSRDTLS